MLSSKTRDELLTLLDALLNETISAEQHQRLQSILVAEPEARVLFREYVTLHCQLRQLAQSWVQERLLSLNQIASSDSPPPELPVAEASRPGVIGGVILSLLVGFTAGVLWLRHLSLEHATCSHAGPGGPTASVTVCTDPPVQ